MRSQFIPSMLDQQAGSPRFSLQFSNMANTGENKNVRHLKKKKGWDLNQRISIFESLTGPMFDEISYQNKDKKSVIQLNTF